MPETRREAVVRDLAPLSNWNGARKNAGIRPKYHLGHVICVANWLAAIPAREETHAFAHWHCA